MSDQMTAGGGPMTKTIAGREVQLAELSFKDRRELLRAHRAAEREARKSLMEESGLPPDVRYMELRDFDAHKVGGPEWNAFFNSDDGKHAILARAIEKMQSGQGEALANEIDWDGDTVTQVCAALCHVALTPLAKGDAGESQGNAQGAPPAAYGR